MRRSLNIILLLLLAALLVLPASAAAQVTPVPQLPACYYGSVQGYTRSDMSDITDAPVGTVVTVYVTDIDGVERTGSIEVTEAGKYGGPTASDAKLTLPRHSGALILEGALVEFYVNGEKANEVTYWQNDHPERCDLTAPIPEEVEGAPSPPSPLPTVPDVEAMTPADAVETAEAATVEKAVEYAEGVSLGRAVEIVEGVSLGRAVEIVEGVSLGRAVGIVEGVSLDRAAEILNLLTVDSAAEVMEGLTVAKLMAVVPLMRVSRKASRSLTISILIKMGQNVWYN